VARGTLAFPLLGSELFTSDAAAQQTQMPPELRLTEDQLLEEIVSRAFQFFWDEAAPHTGLVRDRELGDGGPDPRRIGSIAGTGFALAALCIGHKRGYLPPHQIGGRVVTTLSFLVKHAEQVNGFYYHFLDMETGKRARLSEISPIDTTILLCGVLLARE